MTKANIQNQMKSKGLPWERAKSFDNAAVLSQFISLNDAIETKKDDKGNTEFYDS